MYRSGIFICNIRMALQHKEHLPKALTMYKHNSTTGLLLGLSFILWTFQVNTVCAQSAEEGSPSKGYFAINIGASIPTGQFAANSFGSTFAPFAKTGAIFDLSFAYKLRKNNGIAVMVRGQANPLDAQAWANAAATSSPGVAWTVATENYLTSGYMVGGYGSVPVNDGLSFEYRALIGLMLAQLPEFRVTGSAGGERVVLFREGASTSAFGTLLGVGLKLDLGRKSCILLNLDYWGGTAKFKGVNLTTTEYLGIFVTDVSSSVSTIETNLNSFTASIGFGIRL